MVRERRIREFIPCESAPNLNRCAGWTHCPKLGRFLVSRQFSKFRFLLANRIQSWHPSGCPFPSALLPFLFLVFTLDLLNLLAKWKCTCLAKNKLTITTYFPYSSAFLPLIVISYSHNKTAFITEWGVYVWVVMPFGLKNAPLTYERIVNQIFKDYLNDFMKLFLDDFNVYSDVATHLPKLRLDFERCRQYGVSLNPDKCIFYVPSGVILGYIVYQAGKFPDPKKIEALVNMLLPKIFKAIQTFNGLAQVNQCFIKDYAGIMEPITRLTRKRDAFDWTTNCKNAYQYIKT